MQDEWIEFEKYPGYFINKEGLIRNNSGRIMKRGLLQNGAPAVSLYVDGSYIRRQVSTFMSETWMDPRPYPHFDTPIHLDGDRNNCHVDNLVWRPRWFAIQYHKECSEPKFPDWDGSFRLVETDEVFHNPLECSKRHGFLQGDILLSLANDRPLFPGAFTLKWTESY